MKIQKYRPKISIECTAHLIGHGAMFAEVKISPDQIWYLEPDADDAIETEYFRLRHKCIKIKLRGKELQANFEKIGERDEQGKAN